MRLPHRSYPIKTASIGETHNLFQFLDRVNIPSHASNLKTFANFEKSQKIEKNQALPKMHVFRNVPSITPKHARHAHSQYSIFMKKSQNAQKFHL